MKSVQTEDTIKALLDYFVSPLLSIKEFSGKSLSDHQQIMIAKQLYAVVVLYDYYHRKQFPDLEFIDFKTFCKISCISKPSLLPYLRYMLKCEENSENINDQYSITEKKVINACNFCLILDSCKENSAIDTWPVSKVAVFLVDSKEEKCVLLRSHVTQGVWSVVEKELPSPDNKFLQIESCESEEVLDELAFSAVETDTGISFKNLLILERHLTYSLSHEKTSTWLYIMKYEGNLSMDITEVLIEDVKTSLEGPIVQKDLTCEVTRVVEYYSMLPYYETISSWLSRKSKLSSSMNNAVENKEGGFPLNNKPTCDIASCMPSDTCHISTDETDGINTSRLNQQNMNSDLVMKSGIEKAGMVKPNLFLPSHNNDSTLGELPLVPVHFNSVDNSTFYHFPASKKNELMQASLGVLQKKMNELYLRKQLLEDEIACWEMKIQTILKEGDNYGTSTFETLIGAVPHRSKNMNTNLCSFSEESSTPPSTERKKLSEAALSSGNSCQELDDICHRDSWILPRYTVVPHLGEHDITGTFRATVELHGTEFDFRSQGDCKSSPHEARESAASHILSKLRACNTENSK